MLSVDSSRIRSTFNYTVMENPFTSIYIQYVNHSFLPYHNTIIKMKMISNYYLSLSVKSFTCYLKTWEFQTR
jgi:hypothetical protein